MILNSIVYFFTLTRIYSCFSWSNYFILLEILKVKDNPSGDFKSMYRHISKGSWTFSDQDHGWQVSDCTAEGLKVTNSAKTLQLNQGLQVNYNHLVSHWSPLSVTVLSSLLNDATRNCWCQDGTRTAI